MELRSEDRKEEAAKIWEYRDVLVSAFSYLLPCPGGGVDEDE